MWLCNRIFAPSQVQGCAQHPRYNWMTITNQSNCKWFGKKNVQNSSSVSSKCHYKSLQITTDHYRSLINRKTKRYVFHVNPGLINPKRLLFLGGYHWSIGWWLLEEYPPNHPADSTSWAPKHPRNPSWAAGRPREKIHPGLHIHIDI